VHVILYKKRLLSYFNIIEINFEPGKSTLLLYNFRPNVDNFLMSREYEYVINALNTILGTDDNNLAEFKDNDRQLLGNEQEYIRKWTNKNTEFKLDYFSRKASLVFSIVTDELVRVYEPDSSDEKEN